MQAVRDKRSDSRFIKGIKNKDVKALVIRLLRDGWGLQLRKKGLMLTWANGFLLHVHYTVSDRRAVRNICSDIQKNTGLNYS